MTTPGLDTMIAAAAREVALRRRVYPSWVKAGRMTESAAAAEIAAMEAIVAHLVAERDGWQPIVETASGFAGVGYDALVSWFGFDATGSGERYAHVGLVSAGHLMTKFANAYAWRRAPAPAPLPSKQGSLFSGVAEPDASYRLRLLEKISTFNDLDRYAVATVAGEGLDEIGRHCGVARRTP